MNKFSTIYIALLLLFVSCAKENMGDCFKSVGKQIVERRDLGSFKRLHISKKVDVEFIADTAEYVEVACGENLVEFIETIVKNDTLYITNNNRCNWVRNLNTPIKVLVHFKLIDRIYFTGAGLINSKDTLESENFNLTCFQATGDVNLILKNGWNDIVQLTGQAGITISGTGPYNVVYSSGYGRIDTRNFKATNCYVRHRGTGDFFVTAADTLKVNIELIGNVYYTPTPQNITLQKMGTGNLIPLP